MPTEDLNSLLDKHFGPLPEDRDAAELYAEGGPRKGRPRAEADQANLLNQLSLLLKRTHTIAGKELLQRESWVCSKCGSLNGFLAKRREIRKTCQKCSKPRQDELSFMEELTHERNSILSELKPGGAN
jgi:hypothetical protein